MNKYQIIAKTLHNLESVLEAELINLGATQVHKMKRAVSFYGDDKLLYRANIKLRTALNLLVPIESFDCRDEDDLYDYIYEIPWENIFKTQQTFSIDATISGQVFTHSKYVALRSKDALVDRFRDKFGKRPNVDTNSPDIKINIHIQHKTCTVSLDSTGSPLDKRSYRQSAGQAPLSELLAAGIILMSNWEGKGAVYDLMAGSGTIAIEAALIAQNIYPALDKDFTFMNWPDFNIETYYSVKRELLNERKTVAQRAIFCSDSSSSALKQIEDNAQRTGVLEYLQVSKEDFFLSTSKAPKGILYLNPPYDERLNIIDAHEYYKSIGNTLKNSYPEHEAWIISSNKEALKKVGLKPSFKTELNNGGLLCKLHKYELYKGSRA